MNQEDLRILAVNRSQFERMRGDVTQRAPEEACGILAGQNGCVTGVYVVTNVLHSTTVFRMDPQEQIAAFLRMERENQEMLAIYHSHPKGPAKPSETDIAEFAYPGVYTIIWYPYEGGWACRTYLIEGGKVLEVEMTIIENQ